MVLIKVISQEVTEYFFAYGVLEILEELVSFLILYLGLVLFGVLPFVDLGLESTTFGA